MKKVLSLFFFSLVATVPALASEPAEFSRFLGHYELVKGSYHCPQELFVLYRIVGVSYNRPTEEWSYTYDQSRLGFYGPETGMFELMLEDGGSVEIKDNVLVYREKNFDHDTFEDWFSMYTLKIKMKMNSDGHSMKLRQCGFMTVNMRCHFERTGSAGTYEGNR